MRNRPTTTLELAAYLQTDGAGVGERPIRRAMLLWSLPACVLALVFWRVATLPSSDLLDRYESTTEIFEDIPSRSGRIITAEGTILAEDAIVFGVVAHFRVLQYPTDPGWLRQQARARVAPKLRSKRELVEQAEAQFVRELERMWEQFNRISGVSPSELLKRRIEITERIQTMRTAVLAKRDQSSAYTESGWKGWLLNFLDLELKDTDEVPLILQEETQYHPLLSGISETCASKIESHPDLFRGLRIERKTERRYLQGDVAAHLIGYQKQVNELEVAERTSQYPDGDPLDFRVGDWRGVSGVERYYERRLRGLRGQKKLILNRRLEVIHEEIVRHPREGQDLELNINFELQKNAELLLDRALAGSGVEHDARDRIPSGGCALILDVKTGELLVGASAPRFTPESMIHLDSEEWSLILEDERHPLFQRMTQMAIPPGSVYKTVTSLALLSDGKIDPLEEMECQGFLDQPDRYRCLIYRHYGVGHGAVGFHRAVAESCNVYFYRAARILKAKPLISWSKRMGFGEPTGIDLPSEKKGNLPRETHLQEALSLAIGQGRLTVTPIQIARLMAAISNGGRLVTPRVARTDQFSLDLAPVPVKGLSPEVLAELGKALEMTVSDPRGTAHKTVQIPGLRIAGKTGTAEVGGGKPDHAWFAGYVPAESPRYAVVVVLEHAGSGGKVAGPVARELILQLANEGLLEISPEE